MLYIEVNTYSVESRYKHNKEYYGRAEDQDQRSFRVR